MCPSLTAVPLEDEGVAKTIIDSGKLMSLFLAKLIMYTLEKVYTLFTLMYAYLLYLVLKQVNVKGTLIWVHTNHKLMLLSLFDSST